MKKLTLIIAVLLGMAILTIQTINIKSDADKAHTELIETSKRIAEEEALNNYIKFYSEKAVAIATENNDSISVAGDEKR